MPTKKKKTLLLTRTTVRALAHETLAQVAGGFSTSSDLSGSLIPPPPEPSPSPAPKPPSGGGGGGSRLPYPKYM